MIDPTIPEDLQAITLRCLAKSPDDRYATVDELQRDVELLRRGEPIEARRLLAWQRARRTLRRYRSLVGAAAIAAIVLLLVALAMGVLYRRAADAESLATTRLAETTRQAERARAVTDYIKSVLLAADRGAVDGGETTVRGMLDQATEHLPARLAGDPLAEAEVSTTLGSVYANLGAYEQAEALLARASGIYRSALADGDRAPPDEIAAGCCAALRTLAKVRSSRGDLVEAERLQREVLDLCRTHPGVGDEERLWIAIDFANMQAQLGRIDTAEALLETAVADARAAALPWSAALWQGLHELGRVRTFLGKYAAAEAHLREAQRGFDASLGPSSIHAARCRISLAECVLRSGRPAEARSLAEAGLAVHVDRLGERHQHVVEALIVLAESLQALGEVEDAEMHIRRAVELATAVFGDRHAQVAHVLERHASLLFAQRRFVDAERVFRESSAIYDAILPAGHVDRLIVRGKIGTCLAATGRRREAAEALGETVASLERALGPEHPVAADFRRVLEAVTDEPRP